MLSYKNNSEAHKSHKKYVQLGEHFILVECKYLSLRQECKQKTIWGGIFEK